MKQLKPILLLLVLATCGRQVVQFANEHPDGGIDGQMRDAATDAVARDGSTDGSATDGSVTDGSATDGSVADGNAIDGPTGDAPSADAPSGDALAIDGPVVDAGVDAQMVDSMMADAGPCTLAPVVLGTTVNFAVLAGSTVTNAGPSMITGDLGVSPGTAVTGFGPGILVGAMHAGDPTAATAIGDLNTAYLDAKGRTLCSISKSGNIGGTTLAPGLYTSTGSLAISSGQLTLDGQGDPNAIWIFQMASTLDTSPGLGVILIGMAQAKNVFWQVGSSATIGTTSAMVGTIMADQAITLKTGASLQGRALAHIAAVTLDTNNVVKQ